MVIHEITRYDKDVVEVTVLGDDESFAKMSGGDDDVEPYLDSRNTIGHGNHNSKSQRPKGCPNRWSLLTGKLWWYAEDMVGLRLKQGWAVVSLDRAVVPLEVLSDSNAWGGSTARVGKIRRSKIGASLGRKRMISGQNWMDFVDGRWGNLGRC